MFLIIIGGTTSRIFDHQNGVQGDDRDENFDHEWEPPVAELIPALVELRTKPLTFQLSAD